jgi:signal transduction histidine kinase
MKPEDQLEPQLRAKRHQTNRSLVQERRKADETLEILQEKIKSRTDEAIEKTREKIDNHVAQAPEVVDKTINREREIIDKITEIERAKIREAEKAVFETERELTDESLREERRRVDELLRGASARVSSERAAVNVREEVLAIVSHDLRNPLNSINMAAEFIEHAEISGPGAAQVREDAGIIKRSAKIMENLVERLMEVERFEAGKLEIKHELYDLKKLVHDCIEMEKPLAFAKKVSIHSEMPSSPVIFRFDRSLLSQVLVNLLSNALKFTPAEGRVTVRILPGPETTIVQVTDTGPGIPSDEIEHIFNRFVQGKGRKQQGIGLGLYIARRIVEAHNGRIWVESIPGKGANFSFAIPMDPSDA